MPDKNIINQSNLSEFEKRELIAIYEKLSEDDKEKLEALVKDSKILPPSNIEKLEDKDYQTEIARRIELQARCFGVKDLEANLAKLNSPNKEEFDKMLAKVIENDEKLTDLVTIIGTQGLKAITENLITVYSEKKLDIDIKSFMTSLIALHNARCMYAKEEELYFKKLEKIYLEETLKTL